jgi:hypothetical protein
MCDGHPAAGGGKRIYRFEMMMMIDFMKPNHGFKKERI